MEFIADTTIAELEAQLDMILDTEIDKLFRWNSISNSEVRLINCTRATTAGYFGKTYTEYVRELVTNCHSNYIVHE